MVRGGMGGGTVGRAVIIGATTTVARVWAVRQRDGSGGERRALKGEHQRHSALSRYSIIPGAQ